MWREGPDYLRSAAGGVELPRWRGGGAEVAVQATEKCTSTCVVACCTAWWSLSGERLSGLRTARYEPVAVATGPESTIDVGVVVAVVRGNCIGFVIGRQVAGAGGPACGCRARAGCDELRL